MTIRNYTFFSPNGKEFPVSANADAKLYLMLSNRDYSQVIVEHWKSPSNVSLNRIYNNTSVLLGGRYFELAGETVQLAANSVNYVHANIDPSNVNNPVTLTVETANNSNTTDINIGNGVLKHVIDVLTTDATKITKFEILEKTQKSIVTKSIKSSDDTELRQISGSGAPSGKISYQRVNGIVYVTGAGNWGTLGAGVTKTMGILPVGFRPSVNWDLSGSPQGGTDAYAWKINTNGEVAVTTRPGGANRYSGWSTSYPAGN